MITIWKVQAFLAVRGIVPDEERDFRLQDNSDGAGPFIAHWNEDKLGAKPSEAELDALQTQADALQVEAMKDPSDELDAALAEVQAGLVNILTIAATVAALNETINALRGKTGKAGRIAGKP